MSKTWFITGASRGFGALIAEAGLARGDNVVATARNPATVTARLGAPANLLAVALDVTDEAQAHQAATAAIARFGRIDILLNNAGFGLLGAVEESSAEEVERVFRTNVFGLLAVTRAVLPHMRRERAGHVLNISSVGGYSASAGFGVYGATKFAVEGLTEALALELKPLGIHATVIEPGLFRTDFLDASSLLPSAQIHPRLRRNLRQDAQFRRDRQPCAARRSRQAGPRCSATCRGRDTTVTHALRQRHHPPHRGEKRICGAGTGAMARSRRLHRRPGCIKRRYAFNIQTKGEVS
jgi:NAD(P)-dependent dehydrogenase (short-subunit alcohol dehydrogenase family)